MFKLSEKLHTRWLLVAMAAPVAQAASNCSWPAAIIISTLCLGICAGLEKLGTGEVQTRWLGAIQWLWMLLVISEFLHWIMLYWPNYGNYHTAPLILLTLAGLSVTKGAEKSARAAGVLLWVIALLLGTILLSGIQEIEWKNLQPQWQMQTAYFIVVMLIPAMGVGLSRTKGKYAILLYSTLVSVITTGVMSVVLIEQMSAPFYEMSKSISFLGVGRRFEGLAAMGITIGYFALLAYLLTVTANAWEMGRRQKRSVWISALFSALVFLSGMRMNSRLLAIGTLVVWVVFPTIQKIIKIKKIPLDK